MKYFITGSTGFIGARLAQKLAKEGNEVRALVRNQSKANRLLNHENIKWYYGTLDDLDVLKEAMAGVDGVFHLAAFAQPWAKDKTTYNKINLTGTINIFKIAKKQEVNKVVFTSTGGTFGPSLSHPLDEESPRYYDFFNEYESTKFMGEKWAKDYVLKGMNIVIVHPTRVYGPGVISKSNAITLIVKKYLRGTWWLIPGNGEKRGNYVYIDDVVNGHYLAMQKGGKGEQYILGGENASYSELFHRIRMISRRNHPLIPVPVPLLIIFTFIQMTLSRMMCRAPLLPPKWVKKYMYNWELSSQKAEKELGYSVTPLNEGLSHTVEWIKKESL